MDSAPEEALDRLTRRAARLLDTPIALMTLVDGKRQYFKSAVGVELRETPLSPSFCQHVVAEQAPLVIADARLDSRVRDNPAVTELGVIAYAGVPLTTADGHTLGSFCVIENSPREWSQEDIELLSELAHGVMSEIELRTVRRELQEAEERFRRTLENAPIGMALVSPDGHFLQVNRALCEIVGYPEQELLALSFQDITHPDDLEADLEYVRQLLAGEIRSYQMEKRYLHRGGHAIWIKLSVSLVRESTGQPRYFVSQIEDITATRRASVALREAESRLRAIFDHVPAGLSLRDLDGRYLQVNHFVAHSLGTTVEALSGRHPADHLDAEAAARIRSEDREILSSRQPVVRDISVPLADGGERDYHVVSYPVLDEHGAATAIGAFVLDITERKRAEREARRERDYAAAITSSMREGLLLTSDSAITDVNQALCELTGFSREELIGARVPYPFWAPESIEEIQAHRQRIRPGSHGEVETGYVRKDGIRVEVSINTILVTTAGGESLGYLSTVHDITEQKRYRAELERLASRDSLTGLLNRRIFTDLLRTEIAVAQRHDRPLSVVLLDLDRFKAINDRHGHPSGDKVLREAAERLRAVTRDGDHLARVGGEEFAWILPNASSAAACVAAERARVAIAAEPFSEGEGVTLSAGVCQLAHAGNAATLYQLADQALYQAKQRGRNRTICHGADTDDDQLTP